MKSMKRLALLCMLGGIAAGSFVAAPAHAVDLKSLFQRRQTPLSLRDIYPVQNEDDFDGIAKSFHGTPFNDPQLEYEIMVPKDWNSVERPDAHGTKGQTNLIADLAQFSSPVINAMRATVTIQSVNLTQEISAQNWLKNNIRSNKYDLQGDVNAISDKRASAECVGTSLNGSVSYIYMTAQFNGNKAVLVRFDSPLPLKNVLAFVSKRIVDSFQFILATDRPIEVQKSFMFANALKFRYPESLIIKNVDVGDTRYMSAQFYNQTKEIEDSERGRIPAVTNGLIRFAVIKRSYSTSLTKATNDMRDFVTKTLGLEFKKLVDSRKAPVSNRFLFSRYEVYQVLPKTNTNAMPQEIRFLALGDKNWYVFGVLWTPSENEDFYNWAVNTQDFDMMIRDFR